MPFPTCLGCSNQFEKPVKEYDITSDVLKDDISLGSDGDLLIIGLKTTEKGLQSLEIWIVTLSAITFMARLFISNH